MGIKPKRHDGKEFHDLDPVGVTNSGISCVGEY